MYRLVRPLVRGVSASALALDPLQWRVGTCYIPHPAKKFRGGEDAVLVQDRLLAVCDGVSAWWTEDGVDAGVFALRMADALSQVTEAGPLTATLQGAFQRTLESGVQGSTTVCAARLQGTSLEVCNLGDSGLKLYRQGEKPGVYDLVGETQALRHDKDRPFQLGSHEKTDLPRAAHTNSLEVQSGDVLVLGSDGLWDNLPDLHTLLDPGQEPTKLAWRIGFHAQQAAERSGELDDITVVVARLTR